MSQQRTYLTTYDIAQTLRVSEDTVRNWLTSKKLKGFYLGRLWRVEQKDFEAFVARYTTSQATQQQNQATLLQPSCLGRRGK